MSTSHAQEIADLDDAALAIRLTTAAQSMQSFPGVYNEWLHVVREAAKRLGRQKKDA